MSSQNKLLTVFSLFGNFSYVLTSILISLFIVCLVQLCLLMLFRAFFSWEECGINWQWWLHWKHNSWPLCHYCFCNYSGAVIACQLFWWHLFVLSMYADLSLRILMGSCPCAHLCLGQSLSRLSFRRPKYDTRHKEKKTQEKNTFFLLCFYSRNLTRNYVLKQFCLHSKEFKTMT